MGSDPQGRPTSQGETNFVGKTYTWYVFSIKTTQKAFHINDRGKWQYSLSVSLVFLGSPAMERLPGLKLVGKVDQKEGEGER